MLLVGYSLDDSGFERSMREHNRQRDRPSKAKPQRIGRPPWNCTKHHLHVPPVHINIADVYTTSTIRKDPKKIGEQVTEYL